MVGAATKAAHYHQQGLMYPWEATPAGYMASAGGDEAAEPHVTGDVAVAFWQKWRATHNTTFLRWAYPVLTGVADFWAGRVDCPDESHLSSGGHGTSKHDARCRLVCLTGPDEFNSCKTDEAYTTALVATVLAIAIEAGEILGDPAGNATLWRSIERRLSIDLMHPPGSGPSAPLVTQCYANYSGEAVMQPAVADVGYPLMWRVNATQVLSLFMSPVPPIFFLLVSPLLRIHSMLTFAWLQREIDLDYYWRRTSGFIAGMVWPAVAIGYNEVGVSSEVPCDK